jgi:hypothetical protein
MTATLFFLLAGYAWSRRLAPEADWPLTLAFAVLLGCGVTAVALLLLDLTRIPCSAPTLVAATAILAVLPSRHIRRPKHSSFIVRPSSLLHAATATLVALAGTRQESWSPASFLIGRRDFFFIWGYKAHLFFTEHGIPWRFLAALPNDFSHPDYPLLVPLLYDVQAVLTNSWQPQAFTVIHAALGAALLVIAHHALRDDYGPTFAALGTLALAGCALVPWPGFADGPLLAFAGGAALLLRGNRQVAVAGVLLALAAMTKNEGLVFAAVILATSRMLAPKTTNNEQRTTSNAALLVTTLWLTARIALGLHTDLFAPGLLARVAHNLPQLPLALASVPTFQPLAWIGALLAILLAPAENVRRERFLLAVVALQLGFYFAAYAVTPLDVAGHVNGSWPRITAHVTMLLAFVGMTSIGERFRP